MSTNEGLIKYSDEAFIRARRNFLLMTSLAYIFMICGGSFDDTYNSSYFAINLSHADRLLWVAAIVWLYFLLRYRQNSGRMYEGFIIDWKYGVNYKIKYFEYLTRKYFTENVTEIANIFRGDPNPGSYEFILEGRILNYGVKTYQITFFEHLRLSFHKVVYSTFNFNPFLFEYFFPLIYGYALFIVFPLWCVNWENGYLLIQNLLVNT